MIKFKIQVSASQTIEFPSEALALAWKQENNSSAAVEQFEETPPTPSAEETERILATKKREFGLYLVAEFTDMIGARNKVLGKTTQQVIAVLTSLSSIKALLEGGALATARSAIQGVSASFPEYSDIFQHGIEDINEFETEFGL